MLSRCNVYCYTAMPCYLINNLIVDEGVESIYGPNFRGESARYKGHNFLVVLKFCLILMISFFILVTCFSC